MQKRLAFPISKCRGPPFTSSKGHTIFFIAKRSGIFYGWFMKTITLSTNSIHSSLSRCGWLLIPLVLVCFALSPMLQAQDMRNTAFGVHALEGIKSGGGNTAIGFRALESNTNGDSNTATGLLALRSNVSGFGNTATGSRSLDNNTTGNFNTANGIQALTNNTTGSGNTADGLRALESNTSGTGNTALGVDAGTHVTGGSYNTALGFAAGSAVTTANNVIAIGNNVSGENVSNTCYIGNIFGATSASSTAVFVNSLGKLGTVVSSRRFKDEIQPMDKASEGIFALKPVTFRYKEEIDPGRSPQFGLVAEDVEKVNPDLVVRDGEGKVNTVRYEAVNAMLLNEFLKEHRKNEEQGATITQQRKDFEAAIAQQHREIEALTATVKGQAAQIQKVSAQLEASKPAPQVVNNNQ